jgi:hypothetical protein
MLFYGRRYIVLTEILVRITHWDENLTAGTEVAGKIFINYRRGDDPGHTGRLFDRLQEAFPPQQLFLDVDNIAPGLDFVRELSERVAECDVLLAVIGKGWIDARDGAGARRLDDPDDFVRIEIASALEQGKRVIPVLVGEAQMPRPEELPEALRPLSRRNAVRLTHERFRADVQGLIKALQETLTQTATTPTSLQGDVGTTTNKKAILFGCGIALAGLLAGAVAYLLAGKPPISVADAPHAPAELSPQRPQPAVAPTQPVEKTSPQAQPENQSEPKPLPQNEDSIVDVSTLRKTLPSDVPINANTLHLVQTDPALASAPPVHLIEYTVRYKFTGDRDTAPTSSTTKLRSISPRLMQYEAETSYPTTTKHTIGLRSANFLDIGSSEVGTKTDGTINRTTAELVQLTLSGALFPLAAGSQFGYRGIERWGLGHLLLRSNQ